MVAMDEPLRGTVTQESQGPISFPGDCGSRGVESVDCNY
jgi:hypothetical protein